MDNIVEVRVVMPEDSLLQGNVQIFGVVSAALSIIILNLSFSFLVIKYLTRFLDSSNRSFTSLLVIWLKFLTSWNIHYLSLHRTGHAVNGFCLILLQLLFWFIAVSKVSKDLHVFHLKKCIQEKEQPYVILSNKEVKW